MEHLNTGHPDYDPEMEVLVRLPCDPGYVSLADLQDCFGHKNQHKIVEWIECLERRFLGIRRGNKFGRAVWMSHATYRENYRIGTLYDEKL